jgi:hypothetical protein
MPGGTFYTLSTNKYSFDSEFFQRFRSACFLLQHLLLANQSAASAELIICFSAINQVTQGEEKRSACL